MTRLKLSPIFRNMFDFHGYKLCDVIDDERGITLFLTCTRKTGDCPECGKRCSFIEGTFTRTIRDLDLSVPEDESHVTDAADVAKINWKTTKRIVKKYLSKLVTGIDDLSPTKLGVDEIAYRKGHNYLTVVRDLYRKSAESSGSAERAKIRRSMRSSKNLEHGSALKYRCACWICGSTN